MDIIQKARELGKLIQEDERFKVLKEQQIKSDEDKDLQDLIGEFNLKRMNIEREAEKQDRDEEKIKRLNEEIKNDYQDIMQNENMVRYNEVSKELENLVKRVTTIIMNSANGEDPETTDVKEECGGNCSHCSGC